MEYKVSATIQSTAADAGGTRINEPVTLPWYRGTSQAAAMVSVGQNLEHADSAPYTEVLSITVDIIRPEPAPWEVGCF